MSQARNHDVDKSLGNTLPGEQAPADVVATVEGNGGSETYGAAKRMFHEALDQTATSVPEIYECIDTLRRHGPILIDAFHISRPEFFNPGRTLVFASIANRFGHLSQLDPGSAYDEELRFIGTTLSLLTNGFHPDNLDTEAAGKMVSTIEAYTDSSLTSELKGAIQNGSMLDAVRQRLGITAETQDPFELRVLDMASGVDLEGLEEIDPKRAQDLKSRAQTFSQETGGSADSALRGFVFRHQGRTFLCINAMAAERLLRRSQHAGHENAESHFLLALSVLEHEYGHAQGEMLAPDQRGNLGATYEEARAEQAASLHTAYVDMHHFFIGMKLLTGHYPPERMANLPKGGDQFTLYGELANTIGLDGMLEVVASHPVESQASRSPAGRFLDAHIGAYDGILSRVYERQVALGYGSTIQAQIAATAQNMLESAGPEKALRSCDNWRELGLNLIANMLEQELRRRSNQVELLVQAREQ